MTCEEFREMCLQDPSSFTTAERSACLSHSDECQACNDWFEGLSDEAIALILREAPDMLTDIEGQALELAEKDLSDPEFM